MLLDTPRLGAGGWLYSGEARYTVRPNPLLPGWPRRSDFKAERDFDRAYRDFQSRVPYYGLPYDDVLDWRSMVHDVKRLVEEACPPWDITAVAGAPARIVTLPWVEMSCPDEARRVPVVVVPRVRLLDPTGRGPTLYRYACISFDVSTADPG